MFISNKIFLLNLAVVLIQILFGIGGVNARPCEDERNKYCSLLKINDHKFCSNPRIDIELNYIVNGNLSVIEQDGAAVVIEKGEKFFASQKSNKEYGPAHFANNDFRYCLLVTSLCLYDKGVRTKDDNTFIDYKGCDGNSQSPNAASSNQANSGNTNNQSSNNQSGQAGAGDLSEMNSNQLISLLNETLNSKDEVKGYAIEQQLAKDPNNVTASMGVRRIGVRFAEGRGVKQDGATALKYMEQAANMGDLDAAVNSCAIHIDGLVGNPVNHTKALKYCQIAGEKGDRESQSRLGWLYMQSKEIQQNKALSDQWICKAAAQGEQAAVSNVKKANIKCN